MGTRVGLTRKQRDLYDFVSAELGAGRPAPSYDEMRVHLDLQSKSGIARLVDALVERGWLLRMPSRARSLALAPSDAGAQVRAILAEREIARATVPVATLRISVPAPFARQLADYCARRHRVPSDLILEVLGTHMRGQA